MAALTLEIGAVVASKTASNAAAANILEKYAAAIGAQGTNQEKAQQVVDALVLHMIQEAKRHHQTQAMAAAAEAVQAEVDAVGWE